MSAITLEGEIVHYEVLGRGRPMLFLHGWIGSWRYWIPAMQAASIAFRAYSMDMWGFGDTGKSEALYGIDNQIKLIESFMDNLGIMKIALVGHGLGAVVALSFAQKHPDMVDRMMAVGLPLSSNSVNVTWRSMSTEELIDSFLGRLPAHEAVRPEARKASIQAIAASFADLEKLDMFRIVMNMITPCLLVHGQGDQVISPLSGDVIANLPGQVQYIGFEQSGHFPMLDETTKYNRLLSDFLALNSGESPQQLQLKEEWKRRIR